MSQPTEVPFGNATLKYLLNHCQRVSLDMHRRLLTNSDEDSVHTGFAWGEPVEEYLFLREIRDTRHDDDTIRTISDNNSTIGSGSEHVNATCVDIAGDSNNVALSGKTKVCTIRGDDNSVTVPFGVPKVVVLSGGNTITLKGDRNVIALSCGDNSVNWAGEREGPGVGVGDGECHGEESKTSKGQVISVPRDFIPCCSGVPHVVSKLSGHLPGSGTSFEVAGPNSVITAPIERYLTGTQVFVYGTENNILVTGEDNLILDSTAGCSTSVSEHFQGDPAIGPETFFAYEHRPRLRFDGGLSGGDDSSKADLTLGALEAYFRQVTGRSVDGRRSWAEYAVEYATASSRVELNKLGVAPTVTSTGEVYTASLKHAEFDIEVTVDWSAPSTRMDRAALHARPDDHKEAEVGEDTGVTLPFRPAFVEDAAEDDSDGGFEIV